MLVPWTPLAPSKRERRLRQLSAVVAQVAAVTLLIVAARAEPFGTPQAVLAALLAAGGLHIWRSRPALSFEVAVDADGRLVVRAVAVPEHALNARCGFAAPWLITVRADHMWIPIWPDSVPASVFRRLWVHIRWNSGRALTDSSTDGSRRPQ